MEAVIYNWYTFWNWTNTILTNRNLDNLSNKVVELQNRIWSRWQIVINSQFTSKIFRFSWVVFAASEALLEAELNSIRKALNTDWELAQINSRWFVLYGTSYLNRNNIFDREWNNVNFCKFNIEFILPDWYLKRGTTAQSWTNITTASDTVAVANSWEQSTEWVITYTVNTETALTKIEAEINWKEIIVESAFTAADILIIDCKLKTVKINGNTIWYDWFFPEVPTWWWNLISTFTSTVHDVSYTFLADIRWY